MLAENNCIDKKDSLKETYENVVGIYNLERDNKEMWKMIWEHKILSLFQMEKQSGIQGIAVSKPSSIDDLATLNSVIRLMAQEKGAEQPLNKFARFKADPRNWDKELKENGLTEEDKKILEPIVGISYGLCITQEQFMQLVQLPQCGGFDLMFADRLRKSIAKKNPAEYEVLTNEYFKGIKEKGLNEKLCNYVWNTLVATSRGYGFNASHTLAYSLVGLQEMNLAYKFPIIYWNCACLITDSGSVEGKSTDYDKIAVAIGKVNKYTDIGLININKSDLFFKPDEKNNIIWYGLKGVVNVNEKLIEKIISNRPYTSIDDFLEKVSLNRKEMVSLIKGGAFDELMERKKAMAYYLWKTCDKKSRLTLQNLPGLIEYKLLPQDTEERKLSKRVFEFNRYLKAICSTKEDSNNYHLDDRALSFLSEIDGLSSTENNKINKKIWDKKYYQKYMDVFREWINSDKENILKELNFRIFEKDWNKYALGTLSSWEMDSLCYYYHEHELANINAEKYGLKNYSDLGEPVVIRYWKNNPIYELNMIYGTCIAKNKAKATISLLCPDKTVIPVKFNKEFFSMFDKQIKVPELGVTEKSWFNKGTKLAVLGVKRENEFVSKKYSSSKVHQIYKITSIKSNGELELTGERIQGVEEESEE